MATNQCSEELTVTDNDNALLRPLPQRVNERVDPAMKRIVGLDGYAKFVEGTNWPPRVGQCTEVQPGKPTGQIVR